MMRSILVRLLLLSLVWMVSSLSAHENDYKLRFNYIGEEVSPLRMSDIRLGYSYLVKQYAEDYHIDITMVYGSNGIQAAQEFNNKEFEYLGMTFSSAARLLPLYQASAGDIYVSSMGNQILDRFVAVVRVSDSSDLKSYQGKKAVLMEKMFNSEIFSDTLSMDTFQKRFADSFKPDYVDNHNRAVLKVFFNQADIAFVPLRTFEMAKTMNPSTGKKLKIIFTSPEVYGYGVEVFHNALPAATNTRIEQANDDITRTENGKQLMRIMKISKRERITLQQLKNYLKFYIQYYERVRAFEKKRLSVSLMPSKMGKKGIYV